MQLSCLLLLTLAASPFVLAIPRKHPSYGQWEPWGGARHSTTTMTSAIPCTTESAKHSTKTSTSAKSFTTDSVKPAITILTSAKYSTKTSTSVWHSTKTSSAKPSIKTSTSAKSFTMTSTSTIASSTAKAAASTPVSTSPSTAVSSPSSSSTPSTSGDCIANSGKDSLLYSGPFTINNNLWGMATGSGSQCLASASGGNPVAWSTTWSWENIAADVSTENYIKSYANAYDPSVACQALSDYKTIPTSWTWSYDVSQTAIVADVAYDAFFGGSECVPPGPTYPIEVMIWLGAYGGLGPIGSTDDGGSATPIGSVVSDGITFNLFSGKNTGTGSTVYSFIVADGSLQHSYSGDLLPFFTYLEKFESGLSKMLLQSIQAGTEAVKGSATFSTSSYTISSS